MKAISVMMAFFQFILMIWIGDGALGTIPQQAYGFILMWLGLSFIFNLCSLKQFSVNYLISFFSYLLKTPQKIKNHNICPQRYTCPPWFVGKLSLPLGYDQFYAYS